MEGCEQTPRQAQYTELHGAARKQASRQLNVPGFGFFRICPACVGRPFPRPPLGPLARVEHGGLGGECAGTRGHLVQPDASNGSGLRPCPLRSSELGDDVYRCSRVPLSSDIVFLEVGAGYDYEAPIDESSSREEQEKQEEF